jgi:hypothetical protein
LNRELSKLLERLEPKTAEPVTPVPSEVPMAQAPVVETPIDVSTPATPADEPTTDPGI